MAAVSAQEIPAPLDAKRLHKLRTAVTDFDREHLLWSSGYLAGLADPDRLHGAVSATPAAATKDLPVWSIFYATETGNSRHIAEELLKRARQAAVEAVLLDLRDARPRALSDVENALFVVATHGIGEAPEGSEPFFDYWFSDKAPRLYKLNYAVLAVGDSSYADFCETGRLLDERLQQLGANSIRDRVECDIDFDEAAAAWTNEVIDQLRSQVNSDTTARTPYLRPVDSSIEYSRARPFCAAILTAQRITAKASSKDVRHIELDLANSGLTYLPGDSLGVLPQNPPQLVSQLLHNLKLDGEQPVTLDGHSIPLSKVLAERREITVVSRALLTAVSVEHQGLHRILDDRDELAALFKTKQLSDIVAEYAVNWEAQQFVDVLRTLTPRLYSIASSPDVNPEEAHLTVAVVNYEQYGRMHWGSASNFLINGATSVPAYIESNDHFHLPEDSDTPIIMIAAGTGIAPYRAFVEHRREHGHTGDNWLIFGERNLRSDFLYQREWLRYRKEGSVRHLDVAFSRDQQDKIYVQHRILERARRVYAWLERGAHIYVCGDADRMAVDVNAALLSVLRSEGGLDDEQSMNRLAELKAAHRYRRDVY